MSFAVVFSNHAEKFLFKLKKEDQETILKRLNSIRDNPYPSLKKLKGNRLWRLRVMDYRVIIDLIIKGNTIFIVTIGHRRNVYE